MNLEVQPPGFSRALADRLSPRYSALYPPMTDVENIKSRLDIVDIVREYIPGLKPAGTNWRACCPFHQERSPSFMVSKPKQIYHCFGCGEGGDVFSFVMKQEGLEFPEVLKLLAEKAGVTLQEKPQQAQARTEKQHLGEVMEVAVMFWSDQLWRSTSPMAKDARAYLQNERQLLPETIREWRLGFAADSWDSLVNHLTTLGYKEDDAIRAGVAIRKTEGRGRGSYDRFRNRIIFPICDGQGRVVGCTARTLSAKTDEAKYVNTPETLLYHKGGVLFGLDRAKQAIRRDGLAVLVEGNMDVIGSHQAGVSNVVAASGTALTEDQIRLLQRHTESVAFCFDSDAAGEAATMRSLMIALKAFAKVAIVRLPKRADGTTYKDPDECARENVEGWKQAIATAEPVMEHYFREAERLDLTTLEGKQNATGVILKLIAELPDAVSSAHYLQRLSNLVRVPEQHLREALKKNTRPAASTPPTAVKPLAASRDNVEVLSERFVAGLIAIPTASSRIMAEVPEEMVAVSVRPLYSAMHLYYTVHHLAGPITWLSDAFETHLASQPSGADLQAQLAVLSLLADKDYANLEPAERETDVVATGHRLKRIFLKAKAQQLASDIQRLEQQPADPERLRALLEAFRTVSTDISDLDHRIIRS